MILFTASRTGKLSAALSERSVGYAVFQKLLRKRDVKVNGVRVCADVSLSSGDRVEAYYSVDVPVVFESGRILVADKPSNMEVQGDGSLESLLSEGRPNLRACHRLDRNTAGLVIFAKDDETEKRVSDGISSGSIRKSYECVSVGKNAGGLAGSHEAYLFKDAKLGKVFILKEPSKGAKKILTNVRVLDKINEELLRAEVSIETGRTHQIRAHLAYLGYPVLGDEKYGDYTANRKYRKSSQMLLAKSIVFTGGDFAELDGKVLFSQRELTL